MGEFVSLNKGHRRDQFESGNVELDNYLKHYARQDQKRGASQTWVLANPNNPFQIETYYTLSAHSVVCEQLRFPYRAIPTILLGRLAVSRSSQGKNYGRIAVVDALLRSKKISSEIGLRFCTSSANKPRRRSILSKAQLQTFNGFRILVL